MSEGLSLDRFVRALTRNVPVRVTWEHTGLLDFGRTYHYRFSIFPTVEDGQAFHPFTLYVRVNPGWSGTLRYAVAKTADAIRGVNYRTSENCGMRLRGLEVELGERDGYVEFDHV